MNWDYVNKRMAEIDAEMNPELRMIKTLELAAEIDPDDEQHEQITKVLQ